MITRDDLNQYPTPNAAQWSSMFCGVSDPGSGNTAPPGNVCLHMEQTQAMSPDISFDIDSFLGFASSLGVARNGLLHQPSPQPWQNLATDVHFGFEATETDSNTDGSTNLRFAMLRDVPHLFLGRLAGAENITIHIFFPHLETPPGISILTNAQLARWTDKILYPAIYKYHPAHFTQHLPSGYQHAQANSRARRVEARKTQSLGYQTQQAISYFLPPEHLVSIWKDIHDTITCTPGVHDFRGAQIYLSGKGVKLQFKTTLSRPSMLDAINHFHAYTEQTLNLGYIQFDRFYVDIGKEICPPDTSLTSEQLAHNIEPQVYSWKRCCLE